MKYSTIAVIGAGRVGATTAYAIMLGNMAAEVLLVDIDEVRCKGEVMDLSDALPMQHSTRVRQASAQEAGQADIIVIAAGVAQKPGQTREELVQTNQKIIASVINSIKPIKSDAIIIMITNPVDVLTQCAQEASGLPRSQVFGSGTFLDTQRLCGGIARKLGIAEESVHAYVLGEHGDTQFPVWSSAYIDGVPIDEFPGITKQDLEKIAKATQEKAYEIIKCKEATYYGIASCVAQLCKMIIFDQKCIVPVSCYSESFDVCLSVPVVLGARGIEKILPVKLNEKEQELLKASAKKLKNMRGMCE